MPNGSKHSLASDWEVAVVESIGGGVGGVVTNWTFQFRSALLDLRHEVTFVGVGAGVGAKLGVGKSTSISFSPITCNRPFSLADLQAAPARLTSVSAGVLVTFSISYLSAHKLFDSHMLSGSGIGVDAGMITTIGWWKLTGSPQPYALRSFELHEPLPWFAAHVEHVWQECHDTKLRANDHSHCLHAPLRRFTNVSHPVPSANRSYMIPPE